MRSCGDSTPGMPKLGNYCCSDPLGRPGLQGWRAIYLLPINQARPKRATVSNSKCSPPVRKCFSILNPS